jgi:hypothetical protein
VFEAAGLVMRGSTEVEDPETHCFEDVAQWIELMRDADSLLTALTDDEIADGLARLRCDPDDRLAPVALTLLCFARDA